MASIESFLSDLKSEGAALVKREILEFLQIMRADSDEFIAKQGRKCESYIIQLSTNLITKDQYQKYLADIKSLVAMNAKYQEVAAKARYQRMTDGITNLLVGGLLKLLP